MSLNNGVVQTVLNYKNGVKSEIQTQPYIETKYEQEETK